MGSKLTEIAFLKERSQMSRFRKSCILLIGVCLTTTIATPSASAISAKSKPTQPVITSIAAIRGSSKGKVSVIVNFSRAETSSKTPLLLTVVKVGKATCIAKKSATKCTVKNVAVGKIFVVTARAKNRIGFGKSSVKVSFRTAIGSRWIPTTGGSTPTTGGSTGSVGAVSPSLSFSSELVPINGTVTGAHYGTGVSVPNRSLVGYEVCGSLAIDKAIFDYASGPILPCNQSDKVLLKYEGIIPRSDRGVLKVQFDARFDDGVYISIGGIELLNRWSDGPYRLATAQRTLDLTKDHAIEIWFYENGGLAAFDLFWRSVSPIPVVSNPSTPQTTTPRSITTVCVPDSFSMTVLNNDRGRWAVFPDSRVRMWLWAGIKSKYNSMSAIAEKNDSVYFNARQALNECRRISYRFDDYESVYLTVDSGGTYRSVASLLTS
jgi:hypothetical protein